ncbi:PAQR family membrane homeostasis protein TrhA [Garciella nitratireducens]|uniref:Hemolysin III n=1 Tax=Garciella nitratireducens DSM 15102 TaxID=1121911 RepID=A0A1T4MPP7_9FIRM|nr:hemolysin III family protein [Garciella nitratireducens]RBP44814.1 hemolysin III [Garciella nitratireducens]SJZ69100.1 hemolysin III [Garciella nitratireducens DSM 15102]
MKALDSSKSNKLHIKDPGSAITHCIGILLSIFGTALLLRFSLIQGTLRHIISFSIYGGSLVLLYTASTVYHTLDISSKITEILRKIDHMMIFVLIAGTYTPICLIALKGVWRWGMLIAIWLLAFVGIFVKAFWMGAPRWLSTLFYTLMGWLAIVAIVPLIHSLPTGGIVWLILGGLFYSIGALIYGLKRPRLPFKHFGFHEVFHVFVLLGSFCHYLVMFQYVLKIS